MEELHARELAEHECMEDALGDFGSCLRVELEAASKGVAAQDGIAGVEPDHIHVAHRQQRRLARTSHQCLKSEKHIAARARGIARAAGLAAAALLVGPAASTLADTPDGEVLTRREQLRLVGTVCSARRVHARLHESSAREHVEALRRRSFTIEDVIPLVRTARA